MAQRLGLETDVLKAEWGKPISPDDVKKKLAEKKYAAVTVVHNETSTGVDLRPRRRSRRSSARTPTRSSSPTS